ncbi:hypothetical protein JCM8097_009162 [Rhodosporidiobolus ruineniae]
MSTTPAPLPAAHAPATFTPVPSFITQLATSPYPAWTTSAVLLGAVPLCVKAPRGFPHLIQLPLFAAVFGGTGYMIKEDPLNGAGTTTAWSLIYLFFNARRALTPSVRTGLRKPVPVGLAAWMAGQAGVYGWWYFAQ